jgi:DNA repair/transcription protein MET18/MMS19
VDSACLSATPAFGSLGINLFLEKLAIGSLLTKVRVSFNNCCQSNIAASHVAGRFTDDGRLFTYLWDQHSEGVWSESLECIETRGMYSITAHCINGPCSEIFQPTDSLTEEIALHTLRAFVRVLLLSSSDGTDDTIDAVVRTICTDSFGSIGEPEKAKAKAGIKVLCTLVDIPCTLMLALLEMG